MTDARIEAAARALCERQGYPSSGSELASSCGCDQNWQAFEGDAEVALTAAGAATKVHIVPHNIPDDRMRVAKNTLRCWKGGALSDEDAIGMIVCAVANAPLKGGGNGRDSA